MQKEGPANEPPRACGLFSNTADNPSSDRNKDRVERAEPKTNRSKASERRPANERNTKSSVYLVASFLAISLFRFCLAIATLNRPKSDKEARSFFDFNFVPHDVASN